LRLDPDVARQLVEQEILRRFTVCDLSSDARLPLLATAARERVAGGRIYDAHIAEVARLGGASGVVTENRRHFVGLLRHGLHVWTAVEFLSEAGL